MYNSISMDMVVGPIAKVKIEAVNDFLSFLYSLFLGRAYRGVRF